MSVAKQALTRPEQQGLKEYLRRWGEPEALALAMRLPLEPSGLERVGAALSALKGQMPISPVVRENQVVLKLLMGNSDDVIYRAFELGTDHAPAMLVHIDEMIASSQVMANLESLILWLREEPLPREAAELARLLRCRSVTAPEAQSVTTVGAVLSAILRGDSVLLAEGLPAGIVLATQGWETRSPEEPLSEPVVQGPKVGFVEAALVNLGLLRRRLQDERLRVEQFRVGERSNTIVYLVYVNDIAAPSIVEEVRRRLKRTKIDGVLDAGNINELIEDHPYTPFPLLQVTERPDVTAAAILEGRVALIVDTSPHALIAPASFQAMLQSAEDYYAHWTWGSFTRSLRYLFLVAALLGPAAYIAIVTFHHEMLPTDLLLTIMKAREGVPFPALVEALLMELTFEALREAGVRLPKPVGQSVSIVGGLVIGQAAIQAGIASPAMVIVVALTGISSFIIPNFNMAIAVRLLRFPMMFLAGTFGFFGVAVGLLAISVHLANLRSFGVAYMSPVLPDSTEDVQDLIIRLPWWFMRKRPKPFFLRDKTRVGAGAQPGPPK